MAETLKYYNDANLSAGRIDAGSPEESRWFYHPEWSPEPKVPNLESAWRYYFRPEVWNARQERIHAACQDKSGNPMDYPWAASCPRQGKVIAAPHSPNREWLGQEERKCPHCGTHLNRQKDVISHPRAGQVGPGRYSKDLHLNVPVLFADGEMRMAHFYYAGRPGFGQHSVPTYELDWMD